MFERGVVSDTIEMLADTFHDVKSLAEKQRIISIVIQRFDNVFTVRNILQRIKLPIEKEKNIELAIEWKHGQVILIF